MKIHPPLDFNPWTHMISTINLMIFLSFIHSLGPWMYALRNQRHQVKMKCLKKSDQIPILKKTSLFTFTENSLLINFDLIVFIHGIFLGCQNEFKKPCKCRLKLKEKNGPPFWNPKVHIFFNSPKAFGEF